MPLHAGGEPRRRKAEHGKVRGIIGGLWRQPGWNGYAEAGPGHGGTMGARLSGKLRSGGIVPVPGQRRDGDHRPSGRAQQPLQNHSR